MDLAIETHRLVKSFGGTEALAGVDLAVPAGSVYGLLGPNGAGKTTTIRILATLLRPDAGSARVFGHDVTSDASAVRGRISLTGQFAALDDDLTAWRIFCLSDGCVATHGRTPRPVRGSCWNSSGSPTRRVGSPKASLAGCDAGSTSPPACSQGRS